MDLSKNHALCGLLKLHKIKLGLTVFVGIYPSLSYHQLSCLVQKLGAPKTPLENIEIADDDLLDSAGTQFSPTPNCRIIKKNIFETLSENWDVLLVYDNFDKPARAKL